MNPALFFLALLPLPLPLAQDAPELILTGGRIVTVDEETPEASALAIQDGLVLAVGDDERIAALAGEDTRVIDLEGALAIPGFVEGHAHFLGIGDAMMQLDLMNVDSWEEIVAMVATAAKKAKPGELIRGRGWHQEKWTSVPKGSVDGVPTHHALSAVSPDHAVILTHASGHASFANAKAMQMVGISAETPDPEGGTVVRDAQGDPTGLMRETASRLLAGVSMRARRPDPQRLAALAAKECLAKGVTSFQDAGSSFADVGVFKALAGEGELGVRLWVMLRVSTERLARELAKDYADGPLVGYGDGFLTVRGVKRSLDGALGSHGAWLLDPYTDLPETSGLNTAPLDSVATSAEIAFAHGFQMCVHAIGDRANREVLDLYERLFRANGNATGLRWRIEHAQHLHPADIPRFAKLGVIASMQAVHCTSDGPWVPSRLGADRSRTGAYVWRQLIDSGAVVTNGTDAPVEDVDPIASFHASVTRLTKDGSAFYPDESMTRMEALRSYTLDCAYAAFEEDVKGSLSVGKYGDVVVLTRDILRVPVDEIREAKVRYTIVGGEVVYEME
ncbi:MAG: amidohydrolase [bacterium]|nr:amidohydrolase [bacterium]